MIIIIASWLIAKGYRGLAFWPFIVAGSIDSLASYRFIRHERVHLRQQLELLVVPFYLWYFIEYAIRWIKLRDQKKAYRAISFEQEAYANEHIESYLTTRKAFHYAWLRYLRK